MARTAKAADLTLRRVRPSDGAALSAFYAGLSAESRRSRFLGPASGVSDALSRSFCTPDHSHAEGFVALAADGALVGHLCLEPLDESRLELAVAVADEWQGRGIGRALFEAALGWARQRRYREVVASAYADNGRVLRLLSSAPFAAQVSPAGAGVVNVTLPLAGELPASWQRLPPAAARARRGRRSGPARGPCRVFWRRTQPPVRGAAG